MKHVIGLLLLCWCVLAQANANAFAKYMNARYNYEVSYPSFLIPQGETLQGDGQRFAGKGASLVVYGSFYPNLDAHQHPNQANIVDEFHDGITAINQQGFNPQTTELKDTYFTITASDKSQTVYVKKILVTPCKMHLYLWVYYPKTDKAYWEKMLPIISDSFKYAGKKCVGDYRNFR